MATKHVFFNGRIFVRSELKAENATFCDSMVIEGDKIVFLSDATHPSVQLAKDRGAEIVDLQKHVVVPGFIDGHLRTMTMEEEFTALEEGFQAYISAGYTGAIDMLMDSDSWEALRLYRERKGSLLIHIAAHWFIPEGGNSDELSRLVDEAIAMHHQWNPSTTPEFCIVGIKLIADGVVDGCTAALSQPCARGPDLVNPSWASDNMDLVIKRAADAGLQCAIHAIGDVAITQAIDAIAASKSPNGRHRIEHLELATHEDAKRLGQLGITASVQPVHSDPHLVKAYPDLIGPDLWKYAFAYRDFLEGDANVALGTDAPTARHHALPNLYNATTRRSATDPTLTTQTHAHQALTLSQAVHAASTGSAYSRRAELWTGSLTQGLQADLVVLDMSWTPQTLLEARVFQTWSAGKKIFQNRDI